MARSFLPATGHQLTFLVVCFLAFCVGPSNSERPEKDLYVGTDRSSRDRRSYVLQGQLRAWGKEPDDLNGFLDVLADRRKGDSTWSRRQRCRRLLFGDKPEQEAEHPYLTHKFKPKGGVKRKCRRYFLLEHLIDKKESAIRFSPNRNLAKERLQGIYLVEVFIVDKRCFRPILVPIHADFHIRIMKFREPVEVPLVQRLEPNTMYKVQITDPENRYFCTGKFQWARGIFNGGNYTIQMI